MPTTRIAAAAMHWAHFTEENCQKKKRKKNGAHEVRTAAVIKIFGCVHVGRKEKYEVGSTYSRKPLISMFS